MTKEQVRKKILEIGIIPVVRASSGSQAMQAAEAVCAGGIPVVELTMTVPGAVEVIPQLVKTMGGDVLVGAGTSNRSHNRVEGGQRLRQDFSMWNRGRGEVHQGFESAVAAGADGADRRR